MNPVIDLLHRHRSIRRYKRDPIPDEHIRAAVEAGQVASTSSAIQSYSVIQVADPPEREALIELTGGQAKVAECGAFFVICGDSRRHRLLAVRDGKPYDARMEAFLLAVIDASLFAQNMAVALESMGYGICYIGGLRNSLFEVDRLLGIPDGVYPLFGLCAGVPDEAPAARPRLPVGAVLFRDRYPDDDAMLARIGEYDEAYLDYLRDRGAPERPWSGAMAHKFSEPKRVEVGEYYRSKGADTR